MQGLSARPQGSARVGPPWPLRARPALLGGGSEDRHSVGAVNLLLGKGAEAMGHIDAEEAVEGEGEGEEGGHMFVGCGDECRGLGLAVKTIDRKKMKKKRGVSLPTSATYAGAAWPIGPRPWTARLSAGPWPLRASPWASPLGEAGAEADGLGRGRRRREARFPHPLHHGAVEFGDEEDEALRGANRVSDSEGEALFGGLAVDSGLHNEDYQKALRADSKTIDAEK